MKMLDEVIKALELCTSPVLEDGCIHGCPYSDLANECACDYNAIPQMQKDALHYLREYRTRREDLIRNCDRHEELYNQYRDMIDELEKNDPLIWDELKQMEGKPVWVEVKYHNPEATYKYWTIVKYFDSNEGGDMVFTGTGFYYKDLLGVDWQAYRKEK